ncbi:uncharacterized protein LOC111699161 [Eurytemora carolleeae]|uniref:uncharacterized protein LOC111699161 n=1 Tax=Eurytemora carolleeae TaxID=1294199 RepID=UPI000C769976|nr:uncharacterized protein LOC111699161 [Eurytemora carolleeae]|eukprot:XP_023325524.1 uncharacterized protein LOC111699161 [Eurytemora affinis]
MLALLALVAVASAAPQFFSGYQYPVYPYQYPLYQYPVQYPAYPQARYPGAPTTGSVDTRGLFTFSGFQTARANLVATTTAPVYTVTGNVVFNQDPITSLDGSASTYEAYLTGAGAKANEKYQLGVATSCAAVPVNLGTQITSPLFLINGFYVRGTSTVFNVDGTNAKTSVKGQYLVVTNEAATGVRTVVGCSNILV